MEELLVENWSRSIQGVFPLFTGGQNHKEGSGKLILFGNPPTFLVCWVHMESEAGELLLVVEEILLENRCRSIQRVFQSPLAKSLWGSGGGGDSYSQNQERHMSSEVGEFHEIKTDNWAERLENSLGRWRNYSWRTEVVVSKVCFPFSLEVKIIKRGLEN